MQSEFSDAKKRREEDNPQTLVSLVRDSEKKKRKRKRKKKIEESNEQPQVEVCPKSLVDSVIPIVAQKENAETTTENSNPTPKKKKKKKNKNVQDAEQLLTCDPSIAIGAVPDVTKEGGSQQGDANGNGGLCPKPLLDTPIPIVPQEGNAKTSTQNPNPIPQKKKKKKNVQGAEQHLTCDPSILIDVEPDVTKEVGAQQISETAETTTHDPVPTPKKNKNKDVQVAQQQLHTCDPSIPTSAEPDVMKEEATKQGDADGNEGLCPKPLLDKPIPIFPQEENAETSRQNPNPTPRKKKKKNVEGAEQVQTCDPSILTGVEPDVMKEEGAQQGSDLPAETTRQIHAPTPKKNKKKDVQGAQQQLQTCDPSIMIGVEPNVMKEEGAQQGEANETAVFGINEECPGPDSMPLKDTLRKKKNVLKSQGAEPEPKSKESNNTHHPQQCYSDSELKMKMKKGAEANAENSAVCPKPKLALPSDIAIPNNSQVNKRAEPTEAKVEDQACSKPKLASPIDLPAPTNSEKKKEVEPVQNPDARAQPPQPQPCSAPCAEPPGDPATPIDQRRRKQKSKREKETIIICSEEVENQGSPLHMDITLNQAPDQVQQDQATPISLQPASLMDQTILVDPATPIDLELTMKKIKKKQRKKTTSTELPEISIQTSTCLIEASPIDPAIPMDPCLAISTGPEQEMSKKKKKRKSKLESEAAELNEHYKLPEAAPPEAPVQKSIYHTDAPSIDPVGPSPPVDTETPIDQGQQMTKKKRKKKKRIVIIIEGTETNEHGVKPPETLVQKFAYPTVTTSIDPTIPVPAPPIDQGQKMRKKMRKRSALISKGAEPDEHDDKPPGTPVQRSIHPIAEPSIDPTIPASQTPPVDPATPVDPEPMTKKKRKKKRNSAKNEGLESEKHNADRIAETPVQKTEGSTTENSMGRCNVEPAGKTLVQITDTLRVTKSPFKHHGESSLRCRACRQPGHRFQQCQRLKCLSMDEEVCFFCGEIGHSLGKCDVSQAGGGRFAKCLLCYGHGHFSYNCPQNGHGIDPKVLAVNGAINRTAVEARRELLPRFNM
ncbi:hypothetical protein GYH30_056018 [Glycine max]|nr:hypothetical protein GYH30_056018 [Glycine max]